MKEYKTGKGLAIFIYLLAPLLIGLFGWLMILPFSGEELSPQAAWAIIPLSIAMITLMVLGMIDVYKGRLIIHDDRIVQITVFSSRTLNFDEIKGYRVDEYCIDLEPSTEGKKRIKVSKYTGGYGEIFRRVSDKFPDLDRLSAIDEEQEILNDEKYGWRREIREKKLAKARQVSRVLNWAAGVAAAWAIFYPTPYQYALIAVMIIPIFALIALQFFDGLIKIDSKKGSNCPSVIYAFIYPSIGIILRALDYNIFDYSNIWLITTIIALLFLFLILVKQKEITFKKRSDYVTVLSMALFFFAFSYGAAVHINCFYDNSEPHHFTAKVLDKRISSGRSTTCYLELSAWGRRTETDEVSVDKELYNRVETGDQVNIYFRDGKIETPWFIVTDK